MSYTKEELGFILYNNRSVKGTINNFLSKENINSFKLIDIENRFFKIKEEYFTDKMVEIDVKELDTTAPDEIVTPEQLEEISFEIKKRIGLFNPKEYQYLRERGITDDIIIEFNLLGLSSIEDNEILRRLGATCHPVVRKFLVDGIENGGILIPLLKDDKLINCAVRKLKSTQSLKYTLACPDITLWGIDRINQDDEVWIAEGIFDMISLIKMGKKAVTCSSGMWSGIQLYKLLEKNPSKIVIVCDNDEVGLRTGAILSDFFKRLVIRNKTVISPFAKDPAEHFFQMKKNIEDFEEIKITKDMIKNKDDNSFDFIKYIKNRKF
jgi:DNA primase